MTELVVVPAPDDLVRPSAEWIASEVRSAVAERGACSLALAGGRTPEPVYRTLARDPSIDWDKVDLFFTDERAVPPEHADSNYGMIRRALLSLVPLPSGQVHRMQAERPDRELAAQEYERRLPSRLDVLVLGVGQDGHTASLFPGSAALDERRRLVMPVVGPKPPPSV